GRMLVRGYQRPWESMTYDRLSPGTLVLCFDDRPTLRDGPVRRWQAAPNPSADTKLGSESIRRASAESRPLDQGKGRMARGLPRSHRTGEGVDGEAIGVLGDVRAGAPGPGAAHHLHREAGAAAALLPGRPAGPTGVHEGVRRVAAPGID